MNLVYCKKRAKKVGIDFAIAITVPTYRPDPCDNICRISFRQSSKSSTSLLGDERNNINELQVGTLGAM